LSPFSTPAENEADARAERTEPALRALMKALGSSALNALNPVPRFLRRIRPLFGVGVISILLSGCAHIPEQFPIGLYDVPPERFGEVAGAGFNVVVTSASAQALREAQIYGLGILASPDSVEGRTEREKAAARRALDRNKSLWGWYLVDEPDLHLIAPATVTKDRDRLKTSTRKPAVVVLSKGSAAEKYATSADLLGVDFYPVPWGPVATVGREMHLARLGTPSRDFFAIIQAFNWSAFSDQLRTDVPLRDPSREEIRCMAYLALMQGARGIFFYTFQTPTWDLLAHPDIWNAVSDLATELRARSGIFQRRIDWWPVETRYGGPPSAMYNEIFEAHVSLALFHADEDTPGVARGYYIIAANTTGTPANFAFMLPFDGISKVRTFCPAKNIEGVNGWIKKKYEPYEICIFGPINAELKQ
jgi:hypothetical protein